MKKLGLAAISLSVSTAALASSNLSKFEHLVPGEEQITQGLIKGISATIKGKRDAHPKAHGCVSDVRIKTIQSSDPELNAGLFAKPGVEYRGIMRFSHGSSNPKANDHEPGGHGLALKILLPESQQERVADIEGEQMFLDRKYYKTLDVITISALKEFMVESAGDYPDFIKASRLAGAAAAEAAAAGASPAEIAKARFQQLDDNYLHLNGQDGKVRAREAKLLQKIGTANTYNPVVESYQSWVPSLLGENAIKYQLKPCTKTSDPADKSILTKLGLEEDPNFMRKVLKSELQKGDICYDLAVQKHLKGFPSVEDAVAEWPEDKSPYVTIAKITIPQKKAGKELVSDNKCETLSFNPGHATPEHKAIGNIQRQRVLIYAAIESLRNNMRLEDNN